MEKFQKKQLEANIWKYYLFVFTMMFFLFEPIFFAYLENALGLNLTEMMIISASFLVTLTIFLIPAGVLGDKLGYKKTMSLGSGLVFLGVFMWSITKSFTGIMFAEIIWGIGWALRMGVQDSFLYETLSNLKREDEFKKIIGRTAAFFWAGLATSALIGSLLSKISPWLPIQVGFIPISLSFFISLTFTEPAVKKKDTSYVKHTVDALRYIVTSKRLLFFAVYIIITAAIIELSYKFVQQLMGSVGIDIALFGIIFSISYIVSGVGSFVSHKIDNFLGEKKMLFFTYFALIGIFAGLSIINSQWVVIAIVLLFVVDGIKGPATIDYLNKHTKSHNRATVNSSTNMIKSLLVALFGIMFGWFGDIYGLKIVFFFELMLLVALFFPLMKLYKLSV
ncbi:MAG: MFS transporter [Candidatus Altiarchaeota archaeon]|nr:MFS transporter [Candidatus Altiarchaeota archaeon]